MLVLVALAGGLVIGLLVGLLIRPAVGSSRRPPTEPVPAPTPSRPADELDSADVPALVVQAQAVGVVVIDRGDLVVLTNPAARALGAVVNDRVTTDELRALARMSLERDSIASAVVSLVPRRGSREAGSIAVTAVPLPAPDRSRTAAVALLLEDVTEARRLENVRRDFVANVSHELKTPVGALTLLAEAVQEAADDPEAVSRFAGRMQHEGTRLGRLVGELIALSRVQGVDALPDPDPVNVRTIVDEAVDFTHLTADTAGITVSARVPSDLRVSGNATQLATALANLVDNAVAYSPGGTRVAVTARASDETNLHDGAGESWVEISVTDQGIGIAENDLDRVFERFFRVDPARSRATGGTGLGLAIVKHIVTNHGGRVDVWSVEGAGSTFTIRLPRLLDDAAVDHVVEPPREPARPAPTITHPRNNVNQTQSARPATQTRGTR